MFCHLPVTTPSLNPLGDTMLGVSFTFILILLFAHHVVAGPTVEVEK